MSHRVLRNMRNAFRLHVDVHFNNALLPRIIARICSNAKCYKISNMFQFRIRNECRTRMRVREEILFFYAIFRLKKKWSLRVYWQFILIDFKWVSFIFWYLLLICEIFCLRNEALHFVIYFPIMSFWISSNWSTYALCTCFLQNITPIHNLIIS